MAQVAAGVRVDVGLAQGRGLSTRGIRWRIRSGRRAACCWAQSSRDHSNDPAGDDEPSWASVAGAVLRAARLSADVSSAHLAAAAGIDEQTILFWESGTKPLAAVSLTQIETLKDALQAARADEQVITDLDAAAWCDVVLEAMTAHADVSCLLADPLARERAFGELLSWAISGNTPTRYAQIASDAWS